MSETSQYKNRIELLQGTLDMLILKTLQWGPQHGYGIVQALRLQSGEVLQVETGSLYPARFPHIATDIAQPLHKLLAQLVQRKRYANKVPCIRTPRLSATRRFSERCSSILVISCRCATRCCVGTRSMERP